MPVQYIAMCKQFKMECLDFTKLDEPGRKNNPHLNGRITFSEIVCLKLEEYWKRPLKQGEVTYLIFKSVYEPSKISIVG